MSYVIGPGVAQAIADAKDEPRSDEEYHNNGQGQPFYSMTQGRDAIYRWTPDDGVKRCPFADAAPVTRLVQAIDVSSNNGWDISQLIQANNPEHVVVKLYQSVEKGLASYSVNQANTARSLGKTVGGYVWLYSTIGGATQVQDALATAEKAAIALPILWLDCEQYTDGSDPNGDTIRQAVAECQRQGVPVGIYTGEWWWDGAAHPLRGDPEFHALPLWYADYSRPPTLDVPDFGGWTMAAGHQYADKPVDRSIFRSDVAE